MGIKLISTGSYAPDNSYNLEDMSNILGEDISEFMAPLGIKKRNETGEDMSTTDLGIKAGKNALKKVNFSVEEIDLLIVSTDTPDILSPQSSASIAEGLKMRDGAPFFDLNASCTGFVFASETAKNWIEGNNDIETVMVLSVYNMTKFAEMKKGKFFCVFSDGAGAAIYQKSKKDIGIHSNHFIGNGNQWRSLGIYVGGTRFPATIERIKGKGEVNPNLTFWQGELMNRNPELWPVIIEKMMTKSNFQLDEVDKFIFTQINKSAIQLTCKNLGIDFSKTHNIMGRYGYTGNACVIMALDDALEKEEVKKGDLVCLTASGVGYTMATMLLEV
ncbi:MAG: ketoacyl-ACP synthase III [Halanaerobiales bacterium]|nr:ketoacyl-ACP synthase III [Halanaerobiales bacterium]